MKKIVAILFLIPLMGLGQAVITGKVINKADNKPVPYASVFLSNSSVGARTAEDGSFILNNIHIGQYDLVISFIGFESYHQTVTVNGGTLALPVIIIQPKITQLKEVNIKPDIFRKQNIETFIREFLGSSTNAIDCRILNTDAINISYDDKSRLLEASSDEFLIIENKALGYRIRYQLNKFTKDYDQNMLYYEGSTLFEELKGRPSQIKRWQKNRLNTYKGSDMHFLRSIFSDQLGSEGFRVLRLIRKVNPARPTDSLIKAKLKLYALNNRSHPEYHDSMDVWTKKQQLPKTLEYLVTKQRELNEFVSRTDNKNMLALKFTDYLYVIYTKRHDADKNGTLYHPVDLPDYPVSLIDLKKEYTVFDSNGIFVDPSAAVMEGAWAVNRVADLLPVDYVPQ